MRKTPVSARSRCSRRDLANRTGIKRQRDRSVRGPAHRAEARCGSATRRLIRGQDVAPRTRGQRFCGTAEARAGVRAFVGNLDEPSEVIDRVRRVVREDEVPCSSLGLGERCTASGRYGAPMVSPSCRVRNSRSRNSTSSGCGSADRTHNQSVAVAAGPHRYSLGYRVVSRRASNCQRLGSSATHERRRSGRCPGV